MNIVYLLPVYWPAIGGCELHTHELVKRLSKRHHIRVITQITRQEDKPEGLWWGTLVRALPKRSAYRDHWARIIPLHMKLLERVFLYPFIRWCRVSDHLSMSATQLVFARKVYPYMKGTHLVHCIHNGASFYAYTGLLWAKQHHVPFIFTPLLHSHLAIKDARRRRNKMADSLNPIFKPGTIHSLVSPCNYHDRYWLKACFEADALITLTDFERNCLIAEGIPAKKIHEVGVGPVISNRYDGRSFRKIHEIGQESMILFLGRKHESKGVEEVLKSTRLVWDQHPDAHFVFIGPKEGKANEFFQQYTDKRIIEMGKVDLEKKTSAIDACDILCMPSMHEALGGVFLEAWALGKPVIAGDTPPVRELLGGGEGGFLVDLNPDEIAEKIVLLLRDMGLRRKMGTWGQKKVAARYSWEFIAERVEDIYQDLLQSGVEHNLQLAGKP
jgi:glycosyltransferase involved in cell wall biosynthesis